MKRLLIYLLSFLLAFSLFACGVESIPTYGQGSTGVNHDEVDSSGAAKDPDENYQEITDSVTVTRAPDEQDSENEVDLDDPGYRVEDTTYIIYKGGTYTFSGLLEDGQIIVSSEDEDTVKIVLDGFSISSSDKIPIYIETASKVNIHAKDGTYNEIEDAREITSSSSEEEGQKGAIYSKSDISITGSGSLVIKANCNNGIMSSESIKIKNITMKVTSVNDAIKGNEGVTIESGNITLVSKTGDGIKTTDNAISTNEKQKGAIEITGGTIDVYAKYDGIDSAFDVTISGETILHIYTDSYSNYSEEDTSGTSASTTTTDFYLIVPKTLYSTSVYYYGYFYNSDSTNGYFAKASYSTMVNGGGNSYYGLLLQKPDGYDNCAFYMFETDSPSTTTYYGKTDDGTVNTNKNAFLISSKSGTRLTGSWQSLSTGSSSRPGGGGGPGGGMPGGGDGNPNAVAYSAKGIKSPNSITISGGTIVIYATDDAIHANNDVLLATGNYGLGNITILAGSIEVASKDDGIHADNAFEIKDGYINVKTAYEGIEAKTITFNGGETYVYATDDGLNATSSTNSNYIYVNDGYVDVTTPSGDTDAIDANGYYVQSGGFVLVKGGNSSGNVAGSIDVDGTIKVTGGIIIALGGICETPTSGSSNYIYMRGKSFSSGSYSIQTSSGTVIASFTLKQAYSSAWICSDSFKSGTSYVIVKDGSTYISWTQSSTAQSVS